MEMILRALRVGELHSIDLRIPASRDEFFFGDRPLLRPGHAAAWAVQRYPDTFPYTMDDWPAITDSASIETARGIGEANPEQLRRRARWLGSELDRLKPKYDAGRY